MNYITSSILRRFFSGVGVRPMVRKLSVALKAVLRVKFMGHEFDRTIAIADDLFHTACIRGN